MEKIIIEHVDSVGITLDTFQLTPSKKDMIGLSRVFIRTQEGKVLGYFKVYDDETIEFINETTDKKLDLPDMEYKSKRRKFEVKLESIDPTGSVIESEELSMMIVDDQESMINNNRLFIHIGECLYRVDKRGFIIDRIIPHKN